MLNVRILCPPQLTQDVVGQLNQVDGLAHVVVVDRAVRDPSHGAVVEATVLRSAAQDVLERMQSIGVKEAGEIILTPTELVVSDRVDALEQSAAEDADDAVIWDDLLNETRDESQFNPVFFAFLLLACLLSVFGIVSDSAVTIVGAMVVCPDFGPLAALSVSTVSRRAALARRGLLALGVGYPLAIVVTAALVAIPAWVGWFDPAQALADTRQVAFVYDVGAVSAMTALVAGAAGMLALTSAKSGALIGVFISVTTVPAAGYIALSVVATDWSGAGLGALQLVVNMVGVVVAGAVVLALRQERVKGGAQI